MITSQLPVLSVIILLFAGPLCSLINKNKISYFIAIFSLIITFYISIQLLLTTYHGQVMYYNMGNWPVPIGIEYRIDTLSALIIFLINIIALFTLIYGYKTLWLEISENKISYFLTLFLLCLAGLIGIACSNDVFNIYVFLEISSLSMYSMIAMGKDRKALLASFEYLILGTIGATFILIGIGMLYMMTGTLNIQDISNSIVNLDNKITIMAAFAFLTIGIALKIALFPMHLWLCNAYTYSPQFVTSFLSGTSTKVFLYLMIRFIDEFIGENSFIHHDNLRLFIIILSLFAIIFGSFISIMQKDIKRMLAYSSVAQIGYVTLAIAIFNHESLVSAVLHIFNHAITKVSLFMIIGQVVLIKGSSLYSNFRGVGKTMPLNMIAASVAFLSLIGFPFTVGFISKWYLFLAIIKLQNWYILAAVILGSLLGIIYMFKFIETIYFQEAQSKEKVKTDIFSTISAIILVILCIILGIYTSFNIQIAENIVTNIIGEIL